jgi:hypothetical protein
MLRRMLRRAATICATGALLLLRAPAVPAKEYGAGCAALPTLVERLRNTMLIASLHRARGSSIAAYEVLRTNAAAFVRDGDNRACGALPALFRRAMTRAEAAPDALEASVELDLGYAGALALVMAGRFPSEIITPKRLDVPESAQYGDECPDLFALVRRLDAPGARPEESSARVLADLRAHPRCPAVKRALEAAGTEDLAAAVDAIVLDEARTASDANPIARCPELPLVLDRLAAVINVGAPLYNSGDHEGCRRLYEGAARAIVDEVVPQGRCPAVRRELATARSEAASATSPSEAAWALRHGFDRITQSVTTSEPPDVH